MNADPLTLLRAERVARRLDRPAWFWLCKKATGKSTRREILTRFATLSLTQGDADQAVVFVLAAVISSARDAEEARR